MRVAFRVDANAAIGTGHLMRCLALAARLRSDGAECSFICRRAGLGLLADKIRSSGHELLLIPELDPETQRCDELPKYANWLPWGWRADINYCETLLTRSKALEWIIVDHYALDHRWETKSRAHSARIMVIDDLADRRHDCDLIVDHNVLELASTRYEGLVSPSCMQLLGPRYALLRSEFGAAAASIADPAAANRVLVMFGGSDPQKLTLRTLKHLASVKPGRVDVVVGALYEGVEELRHVAAQFSDAEVLVAASDIAALMRSADLAIGSPGVTSWERCACALPSLAIAQADNQIDLGRSLAVSGAHLYLGRAEVLSEANLGAAIAVMMSNTELRALMSARAQELCDGHGVRRVAAAMGLGSKVIVRPAVLEDADLLLRWRNDERTFRFSHSPQPVSGEDHLKWVVNRLASDECVFLIGEVENYPIASVRFDRVENQFMMSINVDPERQGEGFGSSALQAALAWIHSNLPWYSSVLAEVKIENTASEKLFKGAGFRPVYTRFEKFLT